MKTNLEAVVSEILEVFRANGHLAYGENVTEQQHALQCATLAQSDGEDELMVAACFLHDYGHLIHGLGEDIASKGVDARHENVGANRLAAWFPEEVVTPIRLHAAAKRYLCWKEREYFDGLSDASRRSLALQGGPMTEAEAREFEAGPHFERSIQLRRYDDMGKQSEMVTLKLEDLRPVLEKALSN